jgi:hypothetical protein
MTYDINIVNRDIKKISNNTTVHSYEIKLRGDRIYDLYFDGKHIVSRGSYKGVLEELTTIMEENI